ncbi:hypothetical protein S7711_09869 [Stachybotrys chartarum IBT 7711]|uniref:CCHC-type domain-containing protein n=1 Tax=Stachybotrys chartarum (strain CBS 109288 / IBT 7711) TaxID=1280523 RepID=A0A084AZF3_STACB|nr:hypothetical protein S7711_09869 [Stachybotrys chartarum IBT 7711]KFA51012.1 hypothetical protein S40293_09924 [Stachybotrys chartarum IBT 40293]
MATASPSSEAFPNGLTWQVITPQGARAALLRGGIAALERPISAPTRRQPRMAQTPSSPTNRRILTTAATEGAQHAIPPITLPSGTPQVEDEPISIAASANRIVHEHNETHIVQMTVFRAFCAAFEETAKQFTNKSERDLAQRLSISFLDFWNHALSATKLTPLRTYSEVVASSTTCEGYTASPNPAILATREEHGPQQQQQQQRPPPHRQGQQTPAPPAEDLRVFIRLDAGAQARKQTSYAIRTHIAQKTGLNPQSIHAIPVASGWAIRPADAATRDGLLRQKEEWSHELGATNVEVSQKWYKYVVSNCPRRLTDLHGNEVDYDSATRDEIKCQTGLTPISVMTSRHDSDELPSKTLIVSFTSPTKRFWTLFGASSYAKLINKPQPPKQCVVCWDYHNRHGCRRLPVCQNCGKPGHRPEDCNASEQCVNCLGPHSAKEAAECLARPKRVHGMLRYLTKDQREMVRKLGRALFLQKNPGVRGLQQQDQTNSTNVQPQSEQEAVPNQFAQGRSPTANTVVTAPSCIMVATTPEPERPASPLKRRRHDDQAEVPSSAL